MSQELSFHTKPVFNHKIASPCHIEFQDFECSCSFEPSIKTNRKMKKTIIFLSSILTISFLNSCEKTDVSPSPIIQVETPQVESKPSPKAERTFNAERYPVTDNFLSEKESPCIYKGEEEKESKPWSKYPTPL